MDIIEISRIETAAARSGFLSRFFSPAEIDYFKEKNYKAETIAGNFCAKEAFLKALGTGLRGPCLKQIEILRNEQGQPYVKNHSEALVSISHCKDYAVAQVILMVL